MKAIGSSRLGLIVVMLAASFVFGAEPIFYESFDSLDSVLANGGVHGSRGWMDFVPGVKGNAADLSGSRAVGYPRAGNFDPLQGTIKFWVKFPNANGPALADRIAYAALHPYVDPLVSGDMDGNGVLDTLDLDAFDLVLEQSFPQN